MKASHHIQPMNPVALKQAALGVSQETRGIVTLGHQYGWNFDVLGRAPMPEEPVRLGDWLIVPAHQDTSQVPTRTLERVQAIFAAGLRPKGFVVVHEAPHLLPAPSQAVEVASHDVPGTDWTPALKAVGSALGILGTVAAVATGITILSVAAIFLASVLVIPAALAVGVVALDPMLIAVTQDNYWIEIDRWWN